MTLTATYTAGHGGVPGPHEEHGFDAERGEGRVSADQTGSEQRVGAAFVPRTVR